MNYRHIYHAGNICDVFKHVAFALALERLREKDAGYCVVDTHAGCGLYDLEDPRAARTSEAEEGVKRLLQSLAIENRQERPEEIKAYLDVLKRLNLGWSEQDPKAKGFRYYPGSPYLAASLMRPQDRLIACEWQEEDGAELRRVMRNHAHAHIHHRDGYEALRAFLPPQEKRGIVLVDPPYEDAQEFDKLPGYLAEAGKRWPQGQFMLWYPIKDRPAIWRLHEALRNGGLSASARRTEEANLLCAEFVYREEIRSDRLNGSGLVVLNPPWRFEEKMRTVLSFLHNMLRLEDCGSKVAWL